MGRFITIGGGGGAGTPGPPGEGVPIGGDTGDVLAKTSATDYDTEWVPPTAGTLPPGGATDEVLGKQSATNGDATWRPSGVPRGGAATMVLSKLTNVDFATQWVGPPIGVPTGGAIDEVLGKSGPLQTNNTWRPSGVPRGGAIGSMLVKRTAADFDTQWVPNNRLTFGGAVAVNQRGTEVQNDVLATLPVLAPQAPFLWTIEGTGYGHVFFHNAAGTGQANGQLAAQVFDQQSATWMSLANVVPSASTLPPDGDPLTLYRPTVVNTRLFAFDPAVDPNMQFRLIVGGATGPTGLATYFFGVEVQIVQFI
jgi:hypothetical protein